MVDTNHTVGGRIERFRVVDSNILTDAGSKKVTSRLTLDRLWAGGSRASHHHQGWKDVLTICLEFVASQHVRDLFYIELIVIHPEASEVE